MKINLKYIILTLICLFLAGCTRYVYIKPEKFEIYPQLPRSFQSDSSIHVVIPKNSETKYPVEYFGKQVNAKVFVDLNELYENTKELIEEVLIKYKVPLSDSSIKYLKFTITKTQWESWGGGLGIVVYLEFDVETGDGYKKHYRVQDESAPFAFGPFTSIERAVGGTTSRAVEEIFRDEKIITYIESK